ncbi:hypothetical protein NMY22_g17680 [Coprinellus aureogranulatus]|nr:hypothetical protein NMY22_g17680 [Coprinellus aureogranulatus]
MEVKDNAPTSAPAAVYVADGQSAQLEEKEQAKREEEERRKIESAPGRADGISALSYLISSHSTELSTSTHRFVSLFPHDLHLSVLSTPFVRLNASRRRPRSGSTTEEFRWTALVGGLSWHPHDPSSVFFVLGAAQPSRIASLPKVRSRILDPFLPPRSGPFTISFVRSQNLPLPPSLFLNNPCPPDYHWPALTLSLRTSARAYALHSGPTLETPSPKSGGLRVYRRHCECLSQIFDDHLPPRQSQPASIPPVKKERSSRSPTASLTSVGEMDREKAPSAGECIHPECRPTSHRRTPSREPYLAQPSPRTLPIGDYSLAPPHTPEAETTSADPFTPSRLNAGRLSPGDPGVWLPLLCLRLLPPIVVAPLPPKNPDCQPRRHTLPYLNLAKHLQLPPCTPSRVI